jgi:hypothetical protein
VRLPADPTWVSRSAIAGTVTLLVTLPRLLAGVNVS